MPEQIQGTVNQRLSTLIDFFERGSKSAFASKIGVSVQSIHDLIGGRKGTPSFKVLSSILEKYPQVNARWLVLGQESMLISNGVESLYQQISRAIANQESAIQGGSSMVYEMSIIELRQLSARLHGEDVEHPHVLRARADSEQEALKRIYSYVESGIYPRGTDSQLSERLGISEAAAKQLIMSGNIHAIKISDEEGYRTDERSVRKFLQKNSVV